MKIKAKSRKGKRQSRQEMEKVEYMGIDRRRQTRQAGKAGGKAGRKAGGRTLDVPLKV